MLRGPGVGRTMRLQDLDALRSAEQQLLNAAGAARVAARLLGDFEESAERKQDILETARSLEESAHRIRAQRRVLLAQGRAAAEDHPAKHFQTAARRREGPPHASRQRYEISDVPPATYRGSSPAGHQTPGMVSPQSGHRPATTR